MAKVAGWRKGKPRPFPTNKTGRGGFRDHPEHQHHGTWDSRNSFSYWLAKFKGMKNTEFKDYKKDNPDMTMAALGAWRRIDRMTENLDEFKETANRTEGLPKQAIEHSGEIAIPILGGASVQSNNRNKKDPQTDKKD